MDMSLRTEYEVHPAILLVLLAHRRIPLAEVFFLLGVVTVARDIIPALEDAG